MVKRMCSMTVLCFLPVIVCLFQNSAHSKPANSNQQAKIKVGKDNPFSKLPREKNKYSVSRRVSGVASITDMPELLVSTVTLKSLEAKSLKNVIEGLSSEYGRVSIDEKSNSLIICDTREYLEWILAQIHSADEMITLQRTMTPNKAKSGLFAETVTLKFLDAKNLKAAIEKMSSAQGSISIIEKSNSLIICDTQKNLEMILNQIKKIDKPTPGLFVETVTLKFLEAKNLKKAIDSMSSQYGSIATDNATNSLIICDTKDKLEEIITEIKKADKTPQQIMIEVVIIDVQLDDDTEIGVNWDRLFEPKRDESYTQTLAATLSGTSAGKAILGADFSILKAGISGTIHALQQTKDVEILASPRVLVVSGQQAFIETIEEIPFQELTDTAAGGEAALTSTKFKEVGITLKVKATVIDEQKILMTIEPEQSVKTGESINDVPVVDKRGIKTTLLMEDGQVVVMGGLRRKETRITSDKIPLLGDLPLIGFLFSNDKEEVSHSELIILISPHIYKGEPVPEDVMKKFNELKNRPMLSLPKADENELLSVLTLSDQAD